MKEWKVSADRKSCISYYGNMAQLGGIRRCVLSDGKAAGVEAAMVHTGGGLEFTVLPGRGMDIADCRYKGIPVSYLSKAGITSPAYHDPRESEWLKNFFAGMLTTCGISNAGPSCCDEHPIVGKVLYGLHGDISNTAADQVGTMEQWDGDRYTMEVTGRMSEGRLHGEHLSLRRTVSAVLGEKCFRIRDVFQNEGAEAEPLMFFYHINIGYPILSEDTVFLAPEKNVWAETEHSRSGLERYSTYRAPQSGVIEQQYFHEFLTDEAGNTVIALINEELELGCYLKYKPEQLPCMAQWKVERTGEYVTAFEPGNCHPIGRDKQRKRGELEFLEPMASRMAELELGIVDGEEEIRRLKAEILQCSFDRAKMKTSI